MMIKLIIDTFLAVNTFYREQICNIANCLGSTCMGLFAFLSNLFWCINTVYEARWSVNYSSRNGATYARCQRRLYTTISSKLAFPLYVHRGYLIECSSHLVIFNYCLYHIKQQHLMNCNKERIIMDHQCSRFFLINN